MRTAPRMRGSPCAISYHATSLGNCVTLPIHPHPAYADLDISTRSTRAEGTMALLCAGVNRNRIRLVGRWQSDELYRYLHVQAQLLMTGLFAALLLGGSFGLAPG